MIGDLDAQALLISADDTAANPLQSLLPPDRADVPVALIEPIRTGLIGLEAGAYDIRIGIATKMGLPLAGPIGPPLAVGWTFTRRPDVWELSDPTKTLIARCKINASGTIDQAAWATRAAEAGQALIAYGMRVGVRVPAGVSARSYDDQARAEELGRSIATGQLCAAMVAVVADA
jgi:hypothetical protein